MASSIAITKKVLALLLVAVISLGALAGCGSDPAVASVFKEFSEKVRAGDSSAAWGMLTDDSQKGFANEAEFKALIESLKNTTFAETSQIRNTKYTAGNENMSEGEVYLIDANGTKTGVAGVFTAFRDNNKQWKVHWTLARTANNSSEIPGGPAAPTQ